MLRCRWTLPLFLFETSSWAAQEEEVSVYTLSHCFHRWLDASGEVHDWQTLIKTCVNVLWFTAASRALCRRTAISRLFTWCLVSFVSVHVVFSFILIAALCCGALPLREHRKALLGTASVMQHLSPFCYCLFIFAQDSSSIRMCSLL